MVVKWRLTGKYPTDNILFFLVSDKVGINTKFSSEIKDFPLSANAFLTKSFQFVVAYKHTNFNFFNFNITSS